MSENTPVDDNDPFAVFMAGFISLFAGIVLCPLLMLLLGWTSAFIPALTVRTIVYLGSIAAWVVFGIKAGSVSKSPNMRIMSSAWIIGFSIPALSYFTIATWLTS